MLATQMTERSYPIILVLSCVGIIICILICAVLLIHLSRICHRQQRKQTTTIYILVIVYNILTLIACLSFGFLRTNLFTFIPIDKFTPTQCHIGYWLQYIPISLATTFLYLLFIYRIDLSFRGTLYAYRPCIIKFYYIITIILEINFIITRSLGILRDGPWAVSYHDDISILHCSKTTSSTTTRTLSQLLSAGIGLFATLFMNISLLYMFARSLWKVRKDTVAAYMVEHQPDSTVSANTTDIVMETVNKHKHGHAKNNTNFEEIVELHNLIKKFTILVGIAMTSSLIYLVLIVVHWKVSFCFAWDYGINMICLWMLLGSSKKYWDWCKSYGLCKCCYYKTI